MGGIWVGFGAVAVALGGTTTAGRVNDGVWVLVDVGRGVTVGPKTTGASVGPSVESARVRSTAISLTMSVLMAGTGANCQAP